MKQVLNFILAVLFLLNVVALSGCRESPVLEQIIYTTQQAPVDEENETKQNDNQEDHTDKDDDLAAKDEDENSDTERDWENTEANRGDGESPDTAPDTEYDEHSIRDGDTSGSGNGEVPGPDETAGTGATEVPDTDPTGGTALRQVVDAFGNQVSVPENVDTVTAVGDSAAMVMMLGGEGRLAASSASFTQDATTKRVFSGVKDTVELWRGDGSYGMTERAFQTLLELEPEVCFAVSGTFSFSDEQLARMEERGIYCVTLPKLNTPDNIKTAVTIIGQVLGDRSAEGGTDAPALAADYCRWYDGIVSKVSAKVKRFNYEDVDYSKDRYALRQHVLLESETDSGYYALYLCDWDDGASYKVYSDSYVTLSGTGMAIAPSGYSTTPFSYYMSLAGVVNTAAAASDMYTLRQWYVNPIKPSTRIMEISGSKGTATEQILTSILDIASGKTVGLGEEQFPALIVENSEIKKAVEKDAASDKLWTNYGMISSADGNVDGYGFPDEIGQFISTSIRGDYEIYVVPHGVSSWSSGCAEGVLASMWVASKYYDAFSEDELITEMQNFYRQFYRYDLSRDMAQQILAGQ